MGRATLESLPGGNPSPNRTNIVFDLSKFHEGGLSHRAESGRTGGYLRGLRAGG